MRTEVLHESSMAPNFRPEIDYRRVTVAAGQALFAIERGGVFSDLFGAFERMHEAAGMGPMDWGGLIAHPLTLACAETGALLTHGRIDLNRVRQVISGLLRNVDADDRFRVWREADAMLRGARRMYLYSIKRSIQAASDRLSKYDGDESSRGLQAASDLRAELARLTQMLGAELIVAGLATDVVTQ